MRTGGVGFGRRPFYTIQPNSRAFTLAALRYGRDKRRLFLPSGHCRHRSSDGVLSAGARSGRGALGTIVFFRRFQGAVEPCSDGTRMVWGTSTLRLLEELCESTWAIVQDRHPFRDLTNESDLKHQLRRKLFILAENSYLEDLDGLQRSVLEALARGVDY